MWGALTSIGIALALVVWMRVNGVSATQASRQQASRAMRLLAPIAIVGVSTDILLPLAGIQMGRLGSLALALVGATLVWVFWQLGFSRLRSGAFAAGIAHEINNPLAFVRSNLCHLRREWTAFESEAAKLEAAGAPLLADWGELLEESLEGVDRATTSVRDVRELSHAGAATPESVDAHALLDQVLRMARSQLAPDVRVETDHIGDGLLLCEPQRLKQVFLNLVVNAGQAIGPTGRIRVSTRSDDRSIHAIVEDDGCGMPPDVRERIFDPFFTTKPVGRGTGLGLSIAYEIVRSHGGEIWCESQSGRGSAFHVRLPRRTETGAPLAPRIEIVR